MGAVDELAGLKRCGRRQPGIPVTGEVRETDSPVIRVGRMKTANALEGSGVEIVLNLRPIAGGERLAVDLYQPMPDGMTVRVELLVKRVHLVQLRASYSNNSLEIANFTGPLALCSCTNSSTMNLREAAFILITGRGFCGSRKTFIAMSLPAMQLKQAHIWLLVAAISLVGCLIASASNAKLEAAGANPQTSARTSQEMAARVDELIGQMWASDKVEPAPQSADGEFMRRVYLDLNGVIPRVGNVRAFLADSNPNKREVLVDKLLNSPRYSTHMATTWRNRILPVGVDAERGPQAVALQKWLRARFAKNLRYDNLVGEMLLTLGGDELGPALYYQANDVSPEKLATNTAELFLGVHLHCAVP